MKKDLTELLTKNNSTDKGILIDQNITQYVEKLIEKAQIFTVYDKDDLLGFIAYYSNDLISKKAFLSMIIINEDNQSQGLGKVLIEKAINNLKELEFKSFSLEVLKENQKAISFYEKYGFKIKEDRNLLWLMEMDI